MPPLGASPCGPQRSLDGARDQRARANVIERHAPRGRQIRAVAIEHHANGHAALCRGLEGRRELVGHASGVINVRGEMHARARLRDRVEAIAKKAGVP